MKEQQLLRWITSSRRWSLCLQSRLFLCRCGLWRSRVIRGRLGQLLSRVVWDGHGVGLSLKELYCGIVSNGSASIPFTLRAPTRTTEYSIVTVCFKPRPGIFFSFTVGFHMVSRTSLCEMCRESNGNLNKCKALVF